MFERFSESARRVLFFARYEVTQLGGIAIEPEHLLLGILRGHPPAVLRFARAGETPDSIRGRIEPSLLGSEKVSSSVEIPFSLACKDAIERTRIEADDLGNQAILPEHLVLGVMVTSAGAATRGLLDAGVEIAAVRDYLKSSPAAQQAPPESRSTFHGMIARHWKGVVQPGREDAYLAHLKEETLPAMGRLQGFVTASILRRAVAEGTEFQVVTVWRSLDAIRAFAGEDLERAVVPPAAQALMVRYDDRALHYDIVS